MRSLRFKTAIWALLPIVLVLTFAAGTAPIILEEITKKVVRQRDSELARVSAARFSDLLRQHAKDLYRIALNADVQSMTPERVTAALAENRTYLKLFDVGTHVHDSEGRTVGSLPGDAELHISALPGAVRSGLRESPRPVFSNVFRREAGDEPLLAIAIPLLNDKGEYFGAISGVASIGRSLLGEELAELLAPKAGRSGFAYLVDGNGIVIYDHNTSRIGKKLRDNIPVRDATGGKIGAVVHENEVGEVAIVGFAPVPGTDWVLLTQEAWDAVVTPTRQYRLILVGILLGGIVFCIVLIFLTVNRALRPIRDLTEGAQKIAEGDFDHRIFASSGDEIQTLSEQFNRMAGALKESYADLERRVHERTADLAIAKQEAEEADRLKSVFLATMSHELRTPLHSILGFAVTLQREMGGPLNTEQKKQLGVIHDCAKHLLALITDILDLSKIEAGRMELHNDTFEIRPLIRQVTLTIAPLAEEKGIQILTDLSPQLGSMYADKQRLRQVLLNLLDNAVKFTDTGSVNLAARVHDGRLRVRIEDTGIGVKPGDTQKLFDIFRQVDSETTRKHEGTGLGLAICKKLVSMMGGTIRLESREPSGAVASFILPIGNPSKTTREEEQLRGTLPDRQTE